MKKAIIVHGFKGKPNTNWKPWLKAELEDRGFKVDIPEMPNTDHPQLDEWVSKLNDTVGLFESDQIYLIGHSLGCITILKYLETLRDDQKVKACVFVAGFTRPFRNYLNGHDSFFEEPIDWDSVRSHSDAFIAIHSEDDQSVDFEELGQFEDKLNAQLIIVNGMGHFGSGDGVFEIPVVRDVILSTE
ncbi:MAG: hypothetical protein JWO54_821 [Candidatus Saccharibacteria bacterium]|nr:hypothetical protein [Candidatus Saccharibacteria bacterium]